MHIAWGSAGVGAGRSTSMFWRVSQASLKSLRLAGPTTTATGTPLASVSRLRLVPLLARSTGLGPVFSPSQRSLGHRAIYGEPAPVSSTEFVVGEQPIHPELLKDPGLHPLLKASMCRGVVANAGSIQRTPLTARPEHEEDRVHRVTIRHPRIVAAQRVWLPWRKEGLHLLPEHIRNAPAIVVDYKSHVNFSFLLQETSAAASQFQALPR